MSLTAEQKKKRLQGVGGSEVGALVGVNPWMKPIDVYASKLEGRVVEETHHMERGTFFEKPTAEWYAHRFKAGLRSVGTIQHPDIKQIIVTPDFLASPEGQREELDLSIKVPGPRSFGHWGPEGSDEVPAYALVQVQYELIALVRLFGVSSAVVAAPIDGDLRTYPIAADVELQSMLIEAVERFWTDHVLKKVPPHPDSSLNYTEYLATKFPTERGPIVKADAEAEKWADVLRRARFEREDAEARESHARNWLTATIGDAAGIEGEGWRISYRSVKARLKTDWEAVARAAGASKDLIATHTTEGKGYRAFKPTFKKEGQTHE